MNIEPKHFSDHFNIDKAKLMGLGTFDPILNFDTKVFVEPLLLKESSSPIIKASYQNYKTFFANLLLLLQKSENVDDKCWRTAKRLVNFPEYQYTCIGYGSGTTEGRGSGIEFNDKILQSAKEIVDLVGGVSDIKNGIVRAVGDASQRFIEDRLRILRIFRFSARTNGKIDIQTANAIRKDNRLRGIDEKSNVSQERIWDEMKKAAKQAKNYSEYLELFNEFDMWPQVFPGAKINTKIEETDSFISYIANLFKFDNISDLEKRMVLEYKIEYDKEYSAKYGFPVSIKLTTVKPSGTLSLLKGVTPGGHPSPAGPYYIRRIRIASNSLLLDTCKKHGYPMEYQINFDGTEDKSTMVVSFPCKVPDGTPIAADFFWRDQLDIVKRLQSEWSDNSVSVTVYYKKEDLEDIKKYLSENYKDNFKTLSFLLYNDHGFKQAPYETISKELYDLMIQDVEPITSVNVNEKDFDIQDCDTGSCPIK